MEEAAERERQKQEDEKRLKEEEERRQREEEERLSAERAQLSAERAQLSAEESQSAVPMDIDDESGIVPTDLQTSQFQATPEAVFSQSQGRTNEEPPQYVIQAPPTLYGRANQGPGSLLPQSESSLIPGLTQFQPGSEMSAQSDIMPAGHVRSENMPCDTRAETIPMHSAGAGEAAPWEGVQPLVPHPPPGPPPSHKPQIPGLSTGLLTTDSLPMPLSTHVPASSLEEQEAPKISYPQQQPDTDSIMAATEQEQDQETCDKIPIESLLEGPDIPSVNQQYMIDAALRKQCRYLVGRLASGNKFTCKYNVLSNQVWACTMKLVFGNEEYTVTAKNLNDAKRNASLKALYYTAYTFQTLPKGLVAPPEDVQPEPVEESSQEEEKESVTGDVSVESVPDQENEESDAAREVNVEGALATTLDVKVEDSEESAKVFEGELLDEGKDADREMEGKLQNEGKEEISEEEGIEEEKEEIREEEGIKGGKEEIREKEERKEEIDDKKMEGVIEIDMDLEDMDIAEEMMGTVVENVTEKTEDDVIVIESSESENSNDGALSPQKTQPQVGRSMMWQMCQ